MAFNGRKTSQQQQAALERALDVGQVLKDFPGRHPTLEQLGSDRKSWNALCKSWNQKFQPLTREQKKTLNRHRRKVLAREKYAPMKRVKEKKKSATIAQLKAVIAERDATIAKRDATIAAMAAPVFGPDFDYETSDTLGDLEALLDSSF